MSINKEFPFLHSILVEDPENGISIAGRHLIPETILEERPIPLLRHYMVDDNIQETIQHNLRWANGLEKSQNRRLRAGVFNCKCPPKDGKTIPLDLYEKVLKNLEEKYR